jgi:hypothetical protein
MILRLLCNWLVFYSLLYLGETRNSLPLLSFEMDSQVLVLTQLYFIILAFSYTFRSS